MRGKYGGYNIKSYKTTNHLWTNIFSLTNQKWKNKPLVEYIFGEYFCGDVPI